MVFFIIIALIFGMDYFAKKHIDETYTLKDQRTFAEGRIILRKFYNIGAAGNFLSKHPKATLCFHSAVLGGVFTELLRLSPKKGGHAVKLGLAFLAGGGLGNLFDRLKKGHVVDYVSFGFGPKRLRRLVFNIADFFIFVGIILVSVVLCFTNRKEG